MSAEELFLDLEQRWAEAIQRKDRAVIDREFLAPGYALRIADDPAKVISRSDWLATLAVYNTRSFKLTNLQVRQFGDVAVVSHSFFQDADVNGVDRSGQFFIVDVWNRVDGAWKVAARYSSPSRQLPPMPIAKS
jgi:ketosteroid isomerase-like protein